MWGDSTLLKSAALQLKNVEKYLIAAEKLVTPYAWGNYDILLTPVFEWGGMENPHTNVYQEGQLDVLYHSYLDVHEIAHQWFGNILTYKNFEHFWLNEGLTTFLQSNIIAEVHGTAEQGLFEALQWDNLKRNLRTLEHEGKPWRALVNNLTGQIKRHFNFNTFYM